MITSLILDYNGVISNDFEVGYKASMLAFDALNIPRVSYQVYKDEFEIPVENFYKKYIGNIDFLTYRKKFFELYEKAGKISLYPNIKPTLDIIKKSDIPIILLSTHNIEKIHQELKDFQIEETYFLNIYGSVEDKKQVIKEVMIRHNFIPSTTAYVGDTIHDIETAKKVRAISIASTYGYTNKSKLIPFSPDYFIEDFSELIQIIKNENHQA